MLELETPLSKHPLLQRYVNSKQQWLALNQSNAAALPTFQLFNIPVFNSSMLASRTCCAFFTFPMPSSMAVHLSNKGHVNYNDRQHIVHDIHTVGVNKA